MASSSSSAAFSLNLLNLLSVDSHHHHRRRRRRHSSSFITDDELVIINSRGDYNKVDNSTNSILIEFTSITRVKTEVELKFYTVTKRVLIT